MGACLCRLLCGGGARLFSYKKMDIDVEAGAATEGANSDDDEEWGDFGGRPESAAAETRLFGRGARSRAEPEPEPEPEPDPFAGFAMAPKNSRTQRHAATSVWAPPAVQPASSPRTPRPQPHGTTTSAGSWHRPAAAGGRGADARDRRSGDQPERATRTSRLAAQRVPD